jgi:hypothetical protein
MITATEFIKQIAKPFGVEMRKQGFKDLAWNINGMTETI